MQKSSRQDYRETQEGRPEGVPTALDDKLLQLAPHGPECMEVYKSYTRGSLTKHTIRFFHNCGLSEVITQEELPW